MCGVTLVAASVSTSALVYAAPSAAYTGYSSYVPEVVIVEGKIGETQVKVQGDKTYPEGMKFKHVANSQRSYGSWVVIDQNSGKFTIDTSKHTHIFTNGKAEYTSIRLMEWLKINAQALLRGQKLMKLMAALLPLRCKLQR